MNILVVIGTRPEAIKLAPVVRELKRRGIKQVVYLTGQHPNGVLEELRWFGVQPSVSNASWPVNADLATGYGFAIHDIGEMIRDYECTHVISQGDTTSATAAAQAAWYAQVPYIHVEAGLRSGNLRDPFPEEANRITCDRYADLLCVPTEHDAANIEREDLQGSVVVTGNTVIDALQYTLSRVPAKPVAPRRVLVTLHRRENWPHLPEICGRLSHAAKHCDMHMVLHPNPDVQNTIRENLTDATFIEPMPHRDFIPALCEAEVVVTDSGGLQEECEYLSKPMVVVRKNTERYTCQQYVSAIADIDKRILALIHQETRPRQCPYGDGRAAERIVNAIEGKVDEHWSDSNQPPEAAHAEATA